MTAFSPNDTGKVWQAERPEPAVQLYLSAADGALVAISDARAGGHPLRLTVVPVTGRIDPKELDASIAVVIQVDADEPASVKRFEQLAAATKTKVIAAAYEPPLALVRTLLRLGAHDVLPLPIDIAELEASLALSDNATTAAAPASAPTRTSKLVSVVKSAGGAGATALLSQLAIIHAESESKRGREVCLLDFDLQFGDAAFQLGLQSKLSLADLLEAGSRLDGALLRSITADHSSGLKVIGSPPEMLPLESLSNGEVIDIVEAAEAEFDTVFVDLPSNWTNWSLSLLARSDLVLLVTELTIPALRRARRQVALLESQDLNLDVRVVVNRYEKALLKTISRSDAANALGREISYTIANEPSVIRTAVDRGVPISEIKRKSAIGKDIIMLNAGLTAALGLDR